LPQVNARIRLSLDYRLDTPSARAFLGAYVPLP
jgi:hypothetical protein